MNLLQARVREKKYKKDEKFVFVILPRILLLHNEVKEEANWLTSFNIFFFFVFHVRVSSFEARKSKEYKREAYCLEEWNRIERFTQNVHGFNKKKTFTWRVIKNKKLSSKCVHLTSFICFHCWYKNKNFTFHFINLSRTN